MDLTDAQSHALMGLGIDPNTVGWSGGEPAPPPAVPPARRYVEPETFDDEEWCLLQSSGVLPPEAFQAGTMPNRVLVGAVVAIVTNAKAWTDLTPAVSCEAVRRRFGRLAAQGVWQALAAALVDGGLSPSRQSQFNAVAHRAAALSARQR